MATDMGFLRLSSKGSVGARAQLTSFQDSKYLKASVNPGDAGKSLHSICLVRVAPENGLSCPFGGETRAAFPGRSC
jgi:hypothetical protein